MYIKIHFNLKEITKGSKGLTSFQAFVLTEMVVCFPRQCSYHDVISHKAVIAGNTEIIHLRYVFGKWALNTRTCLYILIIKENGLYGLKILLK